MDRAEQRKLPELYGIAGPILRGGEAFGISVSTTGRIVRQIKRQLNERLRPQSKDFYSEGEQYG